MTIGGASAALLAFAAAAVVIVLLLFGLALAVGTAQQQVLSTLQASAAHVKRWGGVILILVGLWTLALAVWADAFAEIFPV